MGCSWPTAELEIYFIDVWMVLLKRPSHLSRVASVDRPKLTYYSNNVAGDVEVHSPTWLKSHYPSV